MEAKRAHVLISGRVQGVFFRTWVKEKAEGLGLVGWVRNAPEGEVEAIFEPSALRQAQSSGQEEKEKIEEMIKMCRKGPLLAKVEKVEVKWDKMSGEFEGFEVVF
jgi:acylphosphatase